MIQQLYQIVILSWLLTHFSPIKMVIDTIPYRKLNPVISILISTITLPFMCMMCMSFWTGLIMTHDIYLAALSSFIGWIWTKIENKIEYERL